MIIKGKFILDEKTKEKIFETYETNIRCTHCLNPISNNDPCYVCEITRDIYCKCLRTSPYCCKNSYYRDEHQDILVTLRVLK